MAKPLRVGVAGLGVVGSALARLRGRLRPDLAARTGRDIIIVAGSARSDRDRGLGLGDAALFADPRELAASGEIDVFVELIGGADGIAHEAVAAALTRGLPVVTANKAMLPAPRPRPGGPPPGTGGGR